MMLKMNAHTVVNIYIYTDVHIICDDDSDLIDTLSSTSVPAKVKSHTIKLNHPNLGGGFSIPKVKRSMNMATDQLTPNRSKT